MIGFKFYYPIQVLFYLPPFLLLLEHRGDFVQALNVLGVDLKRIGKFNVCSLNIALLKLALTRCLQSLEPFWTLTASQHEC